MFVRAIFAVLTLTLILTFAGCTATPAIDSIQVTPSGSALTAIGQTAQFKAIAIRSTGGNHFSTLDVTNQAQWSSSSPSVATISSTGLATAVAPGATTITASLNGTNGVVVSNESTLDVSIEDLVSLSIIPPSQTLSHPGETSQFIAIGTFSGTPTTVDMTNQVTWASSDVGVATINSAGLATVGIIDDQTTITASATSASGATIVGTAILDTVGGGGGQLPTLAVYAVGLGTGTVTSVPVGINCISGAGCTGNFPLDTLVTLTAVANQGSQVGGWSSNCTPVPPTTATTQTCQITMSVNSAGQPANEAVGAIFNLNP